MLVAVAVIVVVGVFSTFARARTQLLVARDAVGPRPERTTGIVVSVDTVASNMGPVGAPEPQQLQHPVVRFKDGQGREVTFRSALGWTRAPLVGEQVPVAYDVADPANARLDNHRARRSGCLATGAMVIAGVIALVSFSVAAAVYEVVNR